MLLFENLVPVSRTDAILKRLLALHPKLIDLKLDRESDEVVWRYAREHGMTVVSIDTDFHQLSLVYGHPPKVIWIRSGSVSTDELAVILRARAVDVAEFHASQEAAFMAIS